jgi:hypothetical protein
MNRLRDTHVPLVGEVIGFAAYDPAAAGVGRSLPIVSIQIGKHHVDSSCDQIQPSPLVQPVTVKSDSAGSAMIGQLSPLQYGSRVNLDRVDPI